MFLCTRGRILMHRGCILLTGSSIEKHVVFHPETQGLILMHPGCILSRGGCILTHRGPFWCAWGCILVHKSYILMHRVCILLVIHRSLPKLSNILRISYKSSHIPNDLYIQNQGVHTSLANLATHVRLCIYISMWFLFAYLRANCIRMCSN